MEEREIHSVINVLLSDNEAAFAHSQNSIHIIVYEG